MDTSPMGDVSNASFGMALQITRHLTKTSAGRICHKTGVWTMAQEQLSDELRLKLSNGDQSTDFLISPTTSLHIHGHTEYLKHHKYLKSMSKGVYCVA